MIRLDLATRLFLGVAMLVTAVGSPASAQEVSDADILKALSPAPRTRSLSLAPPTSPADGGLTTADETFVDSLRNRPSRSLSVGEREKLVAVAEPKPKIDLLMEFGSNSDVLRGASLATAKSLGVALSSPSMRDQTFLIAGHTDARGSDQSNQKLSERRADAVKQFLVKTYHILPENLITVGYGKTRLKNPGDPDGRENRRVQAVNMLQTKTAGR